MPATVFDKPIFPGAKQILCQLTVTNTSGSYSHTEQDERITSAMSAVRIEVTDPSVFRDRISITTANGSYTISCAEVSGETAVKISFLKIVDDQQFITSTEFDTLDNRIGDLDDLETTDQTSMVDAVNEVVGSVSSNTQAIANLDDEIGHLATSILGLVFIKEVSAGGTTGTVDTGIAIDSNNDIFLIFRRGSNDNFTLTIGAVYHSYCSSWIGKANGKYTITMGASWDTAAIFKIKLPSLS